MEEKPKLTEEKDETVGEKASEQKPSMRKTLKTFGETTSVKGVSKVMKTQQRCLRCMWLIAVLSGATIGCFQITTLVVRYFKYESVTKLQYCNDCRPPFPDITVCNLNPLNTLTEFSDDQVESFDSYMDTIRNYQDTLNWTKLMEDFHLTLDQLDEVYNEAFSMSGYFQNINNSVVDSLINMDVQNKLILNCKWYGWDTKTYPHEDCLTQSIYTFYSPEYFVCQTIHLNDTNSASSETAISSLFAILYLNDFAEKVQRTMVQNIYTTQARGLRVLVHPANTLPDMGKGFNIPPGREVQIRLKAREHKRLGRPYSLCTEQEYLDENEADKDQEYSVVYEYTDTACLSLCHQEYNLQNCGCFNPHLPISDMLQEKYRHLPKCGWVGSNVTDGIRRVSCYLFVDEKGVSAPCSCIQPCQQFGYNYQILTSPWPHEAYHERFYRKTIKKQPYKSLFSSYSPVKSLFNAGNITQGFDLLKELKLIDRNFIQLKVLFQEEGHDIYTAVPAVTFDAFFGSMGGILNLWIGITFFTLIELCDLVYKLVESSFNRYKSGADKGDRNNSTTPVQSYEGGNENNGLGDRKRNYNNW